MNDYISIENLKFTLFDVHQIDQLTESDYFSDFDKESLSFVLDAAKDFADQTLHPIFEEMDRQGVKFEDGKVIAHADYQKILKELGQQGWLSATLPKEHGGIQLPFSIHNATELIHYAANNSGLGHAALTYGAAHLITAFANDELKAAYSDKMYAGDWQGTMAMTEPQAGSSISDITTSAVPQADGSYKITGQKIFISGGDYEGVSNVVHLMLGRIEGAPAGTKGISLFVVPKNRVTDSGLEYNDVTTAGVFHKMGQNGYVTTHLIMGEKDDCHGFLVGEANKGLSYMFKMMNGARIGVGTIGAAISSAAYYASLQYAKERSQGRHPSSKDPNADPIKIIQHADVRRMLFHQKAITEGAISLICECARYYDLIKVTEGEEKKKNELLLDILTPVVKVYPTEKGIESVTTGVQVLGGYGYCEDFPLEQLYRDIRITTLYEGTTGIQSMDLLGRKMIMENGKAAQLLFGEMSKTLAAAKQSDLLKSYVEQFEKTLGYMQEVTQHLVGKAMAGKVELFLKDANLYMEMAGHIMIGWQWLKMALAAEQMGDSDFSKSKIETMKYFFAYELPKTGSLRKILITDQDVTMPGDQETLL